MMKTVTRCHWADGDDQMMRDYHDQEWGVPVHDDRLLFEHLILDGAQAGLSWRTILYRRDGYRKAFKNFDAKKIAKFTAKDAARLLKDPGIIRNRAKIRSAIENAKAFLAVQKEFGSFDRYLWAFVGHKNPAPRAKSFLALPTTSPESDAMSKDLKKRGFSFVGSTICYAFMQASGMIDDHLHGCYRSKKS